MYKHEQNEHRTITNHTYSSANKLR